jgi:type II secretion system protein N
LGKEAGVIREVLEGGGRVTIEKASLPEIIPAKLSTAPEALLSQVEASVRVSGISVGLSTDLPKIENITGTLRLEKGVAKIGGLTGRMGSMNLPKIKAEINDLLGKPKIAAHLHGQLELGEITKTKAVKRLLMEHGLKSLSGTAEVDLALQFDQAKPEQWEASGSTILGGIRGETHPAGVILDDLRGRVTLSRKKTLEVTVEELMARLNRAPIRLEGKLSGAEIPQMVVDAKVETERLDLAPMSALVPALKDLKLGGTLDIDLDVHFPYANPMKTRLKGTVRTRRVGIQLPGQEVTVKEGDAELQLLGDAVKIKHMALRVNDQLLAVTGQMVNPLKPNLRLHVTSPDLNVDRLLPPARGEKRPSRSSRKKGRGPQGRVPSEEKVGKAELPPLARKLTVQLHMEAEQGQYRGEKFQDLKVKAQYKDGALKVEDFDLRIAGGRIRTSGSADLRNLERINFAAIPAIKAVRLESIKPLLGIERLPVQGPLTMAGRLTGKTGNTRDLLSSLRGNLDWQVGQGRLTNLGPAGDLLVKILSYKSVENILMGGLTESLSNKGMPFDSMKGVVSLEGGDVTVDKFHLRSDTLKMDARGTVDLVREQLNMEVDVEALGTVDRVLDAFGVLGKTARRPAKIRLKLRGSLADPKIRVSSTKTLPKVPREGGKDTERETDALEILDKGLEILLGK